MPTIAVNRFGATGLNILGSGNAGQFPVFERIQPDWQGICGLPENGPAMAESTFE